MLHQAENQSYADLPQAKMLSTVRHVINASVHSVRPPTIGWTLVSTKVWTIKNTRQCHSGVATSVKFGLEHKIEEPKNCCKNRYCHSAVDISANRMELAEPPPALKRTWHIFSTGRVMASATADNESGELTVDWTDGGRTEYPYTWLRDNCTCSQCFNPNSKSRIFLLMNMDPDIKPTNATLVDGEVQVDWPCGHHSVYSSEWLEGRSFTKETHENRKFWHPPESQLWGHVELQNKIPTYDFHQLIADDQVLHDWICSLNTIGIVLLTNAPGERGQLHKVADRVAHLRPTNYGMEFHVESKESPSNLAYTPGTLGLHTDQSYYQSTLGMQMLHCISQVPSEGGDNLFVDGYYVANLLKEQYPEDFEVLTKTVIDHIDIGEDYYKYFQFSRHPTIGLGPDGQVRHVNLSQASRDSFMDMTADQCAKFYRAYIRFTQMMYKPENHITHKLSQGEIVCMDNTRTLHGRTSYRVLSDGKRLLEGGYIDWDELDSKRRVLAMELD